MRTTRSYLRHALSGYAAGSVASKAGLRSSVLPGAIARQATVMRTRSTPRRRSSSSVRATLSSSSG
jgi:hypothetical protein